MMTYETELIHHGVKGMKWGHRKAPERLQSSRSDSSVTKRVKNDYNNMNEQQFRRKYQTTKKRYAKRVNKYGDPYMNSPLAKMGKSLNARNKRKMQKQSNPNRLKRKANIQTAAALGLGIGALGLAKKSVSYGKASNFARQFGDNFFADINQTAAGKKAAASLIASASSLSLSALSMKNRRRAQELSKKNK